jgi:hypothetical protein
MSMVTKFLFVFQKLHMELSEMLVPPCNSKDVGVSQERNKCCFPSFLVPILEQTLCKIPEVIDNEITYLNDPLEILNGH